MQTYKNVIASILEVRKLTKPNGLPIYSYKITPDEFSQLRTALIASMKSHGVQFYASKPTREWAGCFVLFAAEWWRNSFQGGVWAWEQVLDSLGLGANDFSPLQRSEIVAKGLSFWGRKVLSNTKGRMFLGTVAVEGGLPQALLLDPNSKLSYYFEQVIQDYGQYANAQLSAVSIAMAHSHCIPSSFRDEAVYSIVAQVAEAIYQLVDKHALDEQEDPLHYLNTVEKAWQHDLPLNIDERTVHQLLGNALGMAVEAQRRLPNSIKILRSLRKSYSNYASMLDEEEAFEWRHQVSITLKNRLNENFLQQMFGTRSLPDRFHLFAVGQKTLLLAKAFKNGKVSEQYWLDVFTQSLPDTWFDAEIQLKATDDHGNEWFAPVIGGAGVDDDEPWVFTQHNDEWLLHGSGSVSCEETNALVSLPHGFSVECGDLIGYAGERTLVAIGSQDGEPTEHWFAGHCISLMQDDSHSLEYSLVGQTLVYQTNPSKCFLGMPELIAIDQRGNQSKVASSQLRWRNTLLEQWQSIDSVPFGKVDIALFENNKPKKRFTVGLLPSDFDIKHMSSDSVHIGQIAFTSKHTLPTIALGECQQLDVLPSSVLSKPLTVVGEQTRSLDLVSHAPHPPAHVSVSAWWVDRSKSLSMTLPFPSKGICLIGSSGEVIRSRDVVLADKLNHYELFGYGVKDALEVEFALQAIDVSGSLAKTAYVKRDLPTGNVLSSGFCMAAFKQDIESLLALSSSLDALVRVSVLESAQPIFTFNIQSYDASLIPDKDNNLISLKGEERELSLSMVPLDNPSFAPIPLQREQEHWVFPNEYAKPGAWLIFSDDVQRNVRPLMWSKELELLSSPENRFEAAAAIGVRNQRLEAFATACGQLATEFDAPEWPYIKALLAFDSVPLTTFDVWRSAVTKPEFMLAMLLAANKKECERIWLFSQQFPLLWQSVKVRKAIKVVEAFYASRLSMYGEDFADIIRSQIKTKLDALVSRYSGLDSLADLLMHKIDPSHPSKKINHAAYMQKIFDLRNDLSNRYDEAYWPCDFAAHIIASVTRRVDRQLANVCLTSNNVYRNNVMNAPVLLALSTCGVAKLTINPEIVHALTQYRNFDAEYFEQAFSLTHQMIFCLTNP
ncbi:STY4851/ECs_5259 family protein [Vibrio cholerae]|uniref:STY4851/ECs_5259 family protein n=1 Tax=Vibrio cholerae TaxID=666 RepID=UPI000E0B17A5|nr:STY4851/ECs_5259 family protein [Vibrio cholerae]EGQ7705180.1 hemolysin [Vibrio cholerae]